MVSSTERRGIQRDARPVLTRYSICPCRRWDSCPQKLDRFVISKPSTIPARHIALFLCIWNIGTCNTVLCQRRLGRVESFLISRDLTENRLFGCSIRNTYIVWNYTHRLQLILFDAALPPASKVFICPLFTLSQGLFRSSRFLLPTGRSLRACASDMMHVSTLPRSQTHTRVRRR